jgi:hypothetical protein
MTAQQSVEFPISIRSKGVILNPWYDFPRRLTSVSLESSDPFFVDTPVEITPSSLVELKEQDIRLFFQNDRVAFVFTNDSPAPRYLVNPIRDFLAYRTFVNYNLFGWFRGPLDERLFERVENLQLRLERIVRVEEEMKEGERVFKGVRYEDHEEWLEVPSSELSQYLNVLNPALYYAVAFYLLGCENPRYFLVEFYKAVESIRHTFDDVRDFLRSLSPYGVTKKGYKKFTKACNDMREAPLDIGRHAPEPDAPLYAVDLRNLLGDPRSSQVFESTTVFCRKAVEAYIQFLVEAA